ncbi:MULTISPECIES: NYN domain-containing protein [unclassified Methanoregula]|uniref:NYN domain-containing protein n=1 Tax=unclassified Methanoregula TaxID=2649730 RepID=UPI0009C47B75|nr:MULTISPECIES: NYN domain-containing protein [unclassified Methanoregula]OPX65373.1 MAG: NYN domain protein [Methanoregula sp. PtaB.Bin085]OPY32282.1 MAG: NYN domain protein [Methanoregula sp. PtaU1.Bin006]
MEYLAQPAGRQKRLAVLIDADNAQAGIIKNLLDEVAKYGIASVKRIYGNWTTPQLQPWKDVLLSHSIVPIQQFGYSTGKNATDSALIIDAMDLLHAGNLDGFCIVSSDSDFTRLASRIRESGLVVFGFGERKTPKPFVDACDKFIFTEILRSPEAAAGHAGVPRREIPGIGTAQSDPRFLRLLRSSVEDSSDDQGWAELGLVGSNLQKKCPEFDARNYGFRKFFDLIDSLRIFEIDERQAKDQSGKIIYIREKQQKRSRQIRRNTRR